MGAAKKLSLSVFLSLGFILVVVVGLFAWRAETNNRSIPGRIVRFFRGESGDEQKVNDLVKDVSRPPTLAQLQAWSGEILARFRAGKVRTNGVSENMPSFVPNIRLERDERPDFINQQWGKTNSSGEEDPEVLILLANGTHEPEAVAINWYLYGIAVGPADYHLSFDPYLVTVAKPGVFVYHFYK